MRKLIVLSAVLTTAALWYVFAAKDAPPVALEDSKIEHRFKQDGIHYVVHEGDYYKDHQNGTYSFIQEYYRPDFYETAYTREGNAIFVHSPDDPSTRIRIRNEFEDDFESYDSIRDLIISNESITGNEKLRDGVKTYDPDKLPTRWMAATLQSPRAPTTKDYVALRKVIASGGDFLENRIEPSTDQAHRGKTSLRFESVAPSFSMVCSKCSISSSTFHFEKDDDFYFSGWFYFEEGFPLTVMDLESTWLAQHSGIRIMISEAGQPAVELKAFEKPIWRNNDFTIPANQWVKISAHFFLDETNGSVSLWVDDQLVVDGVGQTLPLANSILDSVEVGISATQQACVMYLDDVKVSANQRDAAEKN